MISLSDKFWGLSVLSWILIIIILVFFIYRIFSTSSPKNISNSNNSVSETERFESEKPSSDNTVKVYNFNTSWCGWSVKFQPEWIKFENQVKSNPQLSNIQAFDIKCDKPENEAKCKEYEVEGFPTIIIEAGGRKGIYKGPREAKDLIDSVKDL